MKVRYHGLETLTYMGYLDVNTSRTLTCHHGETYDITPDVLPSDGRFSEVIPEPEVPVKAPKAQVDSPSGTEGVV